LSARDITPIVATAATSRCYGSPKPLCKAVDQEAGHARRDLSPDEVAARLAWIDAHAGCIHIPAEQAMELAMEEWIAEENLAASQNGRPGNE
jgi:hypothetical protein